MPLNGVTRSFAVAAAGLLKRKVVRTSSAVYCYFRKPAAEQAGVPGWRERRPGWPCKREIKTPPQALTLRAPKERIESAVLFAER